jgi:putative transposase
VILAHRIALDPTVEQSIALSRACGVARFTWNWALRNCERIWNETGKLPKMADLKKTFNATKHELYPWISESPKDANQQPFTFLRKAYSAYFKNIKGARRRTRKGVLAGRPQRHRKGVHDSFYVSNDKFEMDEATVRLRESLRLAGKIQAGTVSKEAGRWFLSVQVDVGELKKPRTANGEIGIDLGLKTALVCSNGDTFDAPKPLGKALKQLRRRGRQVSRKVKGSRNRHKAKQRLARTHARIRRIRTDWQHKVTTKLARENQTICLEDLNVKGMLANHKLARAISDIGWYEIRRQLTYKALLYGGTVQVISRWFPSTKTCSICGRVKDSIALSERVFHCTHCGAEIDRDLNAAMNIRTLGLRETHACGPESSGLAREDKTKLCRDEAGTTPGAHSHVLTK